MTAPFPSPTSKWHDNTYPSLSPTRPELSAKGKTVLITGGGTGIGAETARYFAQAGASRIALLGRREQPLLDTKASIERGITGVEVFVASVDVTKSEVDAAFEKFVGNGKLHVLVSGAAMVGPLDSVKDVDGDKFLDVVQPNLKVLLWVAKAFLHYAAKDALAIDINSSSAHVNLGPGFSSYNCAKLAPGVVDTDMNKEASGVATAGFKDHVSLLASFHVWLASPEARFLKGKFLWSNWDVDELKAHAKEIEESTQLSIDLVGWPWSTAGWKTMWKS